jgi:hypothetical protein
VGYYIETNTPHGKAEQIMQTLGGTEVTQEEAEMIIKEDMGAVICVVDNGPFEAAAYCYNLDEFRAFTHPSDDRPKKWIVVDNKEEVHRLTKYNG